MIKTFDYRKSYTKIEHQVIRAVKQVLNSGHLILGPETEAFESEFAEFTGARYCIGVNSGTTALHLALMSIGIEHGDEVITVSNTCAPTIAAIELCGATPVFVDVHEDDLMMNTDLIARAITDRTRCILPVHLWGQSVDLNQIQQIASWYGLPVVEDCAQAVGTYYQGNHVGLSGTAGCFSFYPTKNLGAYGDAGAIVTNHFDLAAKIKRMRMYGYDNRNQSIEKGMNARISEIQSAILRVKLRHLPQWLERRKKIAEIYDNNIQSENIAIPFRHDDRDHSFHQYVVTCSNRNQMIELFRKNDIEYGIHYPTPIHEMPAYKKFHSPDCPLPVTETASQRILSLPVHEALIDEEVETIVKTIGRA